MSINTVTTDDLRRMNGKEGLVLQGCGGDPQAWLDGINGLLTDEGILKNGSKFDNISVFQNGSLTNILFPFENGVEIDMGKLAMWRLHSHEQFGGTWLVIVEHLKFVRHGLSEQYRTGAAERLDIAIITEWEKGVQDMEDRGFVADPCYGGFYIDHLTFRRRSTVIKKKRRYLSSL